jgi:hypothetical protein
MGKVVSQEIRISKVRAYLIVIINMMNIIVLMYPGILSIASNWYL